MASKQRVSRLRKTNKARQEALQTLRVQLDSYINFPSYMHPTRTDREREIARNLAESTAHSLRRQYAEDCAEKRLIELAELGYSDTRLNLRYVSWFAQIEHFVNGTKPLGALK